MAGNKALKRLPGAILALVAALALAPSGALAPSELVRSAPAANSSAGSAPSSITLTFSEAPEAKLSQVQVFDAQHQRMDDGPLSASIVVLRQHCLLAGRSLASAAVLAALATIASQVERSSGLSSAAITLGTSLGLMLVLRLAVALVILALAAARPGGPAEGAHHRSLGAAAAVRRVTFISRRHVREELLIALILSELLLMALTSHALDVANLAQVSVLVDWLHLSLAGVWIGGLLALLLAVVHPRDGNAGAGPVIPGPGLLSRPMLQRFSGLALVATAGLALTGLYQGFVHVGSIGNALSTDYGRAVLIKTCIFAAALLAAGVHRFVLLPSFDLPRRRLLAGTLPLEAFLGAAILGVTGVLASLPPANQAAVGGSPEQQLAALGPAAPGLPRQGDLTLGGDAGNTLIGVTLRPGKPGPNQLFVYLLPADGASAAAALPVSARMNETAVGLQPCAATCRTGRVSLQGGEQLALRVGQDSATFTIPTLPAPDGDALLQRLNTAAHQLRTYQVDETLAPPRPPVRTQYTFQAPDRWSFDSSTGAQAVWLGHTRYSRAKPGAAWQAEQIDQPVRVPFFIWDDGAPQTPLITRADSVAGTQTQVLSFYEWLGGPIWFKVWVGPDGLPRRAEMRASGHFMDRQYTDFNAPLSLQAPTA